MNPTETLPAVQVLTGPLSHIATDVLVVPVFEEDDLGDLDGIDAATGGEIGRARGAREFVGRLYDVFLTPVTGRGWAAGRVALIGAGRREEYSTDRLRKLASAVGLAVRQRRVMRLAFVTRGKLDAAAAVQAAVEGLVLADFTAARYKTTDRDGASPETLQIAAPGETRHELLLRDAAERGRVLGESCNSRPRSATPRESNGSAWACCSASLAAARSRRG
ncbi:MAG: hypothetical protein LC804_11580 [Acidobacteria bacterium]|nr:hypothetical protein [Acidobacteriota bacterium]